MTPECPDSLRRPHPPPALTDHGSPFGVSGNGSASHARFETEHRDDMVFAIWRNSHAGPTGTGLACSRALAQPNAREHPDPPFPQLAALLLHSARCVSPYAFAQL